MNDVFVERMVKKKFESVDALVVAGVVAGIFVLTFIGFVVGVLIVPFPMLTLLIAAGAVFGGYKLVSARMLEFEYSLTNGPVRGPPGLLVHDCAQRQDRQDFGGL